MTKGKPVKSRRHYLLERCIDGQWRKLYQLPACIDAKEELEKNPPGRYRILREYTVRELVAERTLEPKVYKPPGPQANRRKFDR
jgi:hypothetical protein